MLVFFFSFLKYLHHFKVKVRGKSRRESRYSSKNKTEKERKVSLLVQSVSRVRSMHMQESGLTIFRLAREHHGAFCLLYSDYYHQRAGKYCFSVRREFGICILQPSLLSFNDVKSPCMEIWSFAVSASNSGARNDTVAAYRSWVDARPTVDLKPLNQFLGFTKQSQFWGYLLILFRSCRPHHMVLISRWSLFSCSRLVIITIIL